MSEARSRILLLLSAAEESLSDLRAFARWIDLIGPQEFAKVVANVRNAARVSTNGTERSAPSSEPEDESLNESTIAKVAQLLLLEAALSKTEAVTSMARELKKEVKGIVIPDASKMSFQNWVRRMINRTSAGLILFVASKIRNDLVRTGKRVDWALTRNSDES